MDPKLNLKAFGGLAVFLLILAIVLFIPAGTVNYWQAWVFLLVFAGVTLHSTFTLMKKDRALLERRMSGGPIVEKRIAQKIIMSCVTVLFIVMFIIAGIDHRLAWSHLAIFVVLTGDGMIILSFVIYDLVFKENSFASSTIEISEGQKVITSGPYSVVRHPMYSGGFVFLLGIPLALGSLWAFLALVPLLPILIWRIVDEEKMLNKQLPGYTQYCAKVKYRLIPGVY